MYIELANALPAFNRNTIVPFDAGEILKFIQAHDNTGVYASICKYETEDIAKSPYIAPLVFDTDAKDLELARQDSVWLYEELTNKQGFRPEDIDIFFSGCYSDDTEILTETGWKMFSDLQLTDKVATFHESGMKYETPKRIQKFPFRGELVNFKSNLIDIAVTPDHKMYHGTGVKRDKFILQPAKEIMNRSVIKFDRGLNWNSGREKRYFYLPETFKTAGSGKVKFKIPEKKILMDDWLEFLGYWLSEGYKRERRSKRGVNPGSCEVTICQKNEKNWKKILSCAVRIFGNGKVKTWTHPNGVHYLSIYSKQLNLVLGKSIPRELLNLSKRQLKILFDGIYLGDGDKNCNLIYTGIYKQLTDDVNELCLRLGFASNVSYRENHHCWQVTCNKSTKHDYYTKANHRKSGGNGYSLLPYNGSVYCCEVSTGIVFVRRNGKPMWCGNSKGFHLTIDERFIGAQNIADVMELYKKFAERMKKESPNKTIDTVIYERRRIFRIPFSKHEKSGLFKNLLTKDMLYSSTIDEIKEFCKERKTPAKQPVETVVNGEFLKYLNNLRLLREEVPERGELVIAAPVGDDEEFVMEGCVLAEFAIPPVEGERNSKTFNLALWCKTRGLSQARALSILYSWSGLSESEVRTTIESAYGSQFGWGCANNPFIPDEHKAICGMSKAKTISDDTFETFDDVLDKTEKFLLEPRKNTNLTTGYKEIDELLSGVMENEFLIVAGEVGHGKSLFAAHMALENAKRGKKVVFMSLEMINEQVTQRYIQQETQITSKKFVDQDYTPEEVSKIKAAIASYKRGLSLYFCNRENIYTVDNIEKTVKKAIELFGLDILVIDHLRYISRDSKAKENEEIDKICTTLQQISQRYRVCIVLLAHYSKGDGTKPREMNQLLGSNAVYREATKILQIWRKIPKDITEELSMNARDKLVQFVCQKNRFGSTGVVCMEFDKDHQSFVSPSTALLQKIGEVQSKYDQRAKMANDIIELDEIDKLT